MKQETCGKPGKGLPKQEKSREAKGQKKAHSLSLIEELTLDEILETHKQKKIVKSSHKNI